MELKALKDQLEVERQMWEANSAKKEVGRRRGHRCVGGLSSLPPSLLQSWLRRAGSLCPRDKYVPRWPRAGVSSLMDVSRFTSQAALPRGRGAGPTLCKG